MNDQQTTKEWMTQKLVMPQLVFLCLVYGVGALATSLGWAWALHKPGDVTWSNTVVLGLGGVALLVMATYKGKRASLANDKAGVSPVIGVILMVAVTVVLAGVVFVAVQRLSQVGGSEPPRLSFTSSDDGGNWTVIQAPGSLSWDRLAVSGCQIVPTGTVSAGQVLGRCHGAVTVVDKGSNAVAWMSG